MGKYVLTIALFVSLGRSAFARDDGRYANDPLKDWFDHLASDKGMCCSFADGLSVSDVDWDMQDGHYGCWFGPVTTAVSGTSIHSPCSRLNGAPRQPFQ